MKCQRCSGQAPAGSTFCPHCAAPLGAAETLPGAAEHPPSTRPRLDEAPTSLGPSSEAPTSLPSNGALGSGAAAPVGRRRGGGEPASGSSPSPSSLTDAGHHGRFLPGVVVAGRYRIVGLLGRGGMGEVYRADDLKLGQQVALKFLPAELSADHAHVARLFDEVRMARKVSHPNVCRVWDVGEADGQHYVSMEYVDGENLASLLRRIGRLPPDKAVEIARQLCAALAAAHDEEVLHRDLKPANIMLDGRGKVKLTDFGLAAVAEVRAGTPVYMAPEQLAGKEVSVRSDLYALGLVLYELFTGKRVFDAGSYDELTRQQQSILSSSLPSIGELDPAVDRVIHRCLESDPHKRPRSALAVAAGLPGADPLAAALAAGETPSPEMVAEAGGEGTLSLAVAAPLLLFALAAAVGVGLLQSRASIVGQVPFTSPPPVLDARAREILSDLGYGDLEALDDTASGFVADLGYVQRQLRDGATEAQWQAVEAGRPASITYWWRGSPSLMAPHREGLSPSTEVSLDNPPRTLPGMVSLRLDNAGRLLWLDAVPERGDGQAAAGAFDWSRLFALMDLPIADFAPVEPRALPEHFADERAAWEGVFPEDPEASLRIEAAAFAGKPVSLRMYPAWAPLEPVQSSGGGTGIGLAIVTIFVIVVFLAMVATAIFGGLYVAQRNLRSGRGDRRGARRLGYVVAMALCVEWMLGEHAFAIERLDGFINMLVFVAAAGGLSWALYLSVEPFMRRHAPRELIGWTRLIDGRLADPLVGRDILLGCAAGALSRAIDIAPLLLSDRSATVGNYVGLPPLSVIRLVGGTIGSGTQYVVTGLALLFIYGLTFVALRRRAWAAALVWLVFFGGIGFLPGLSVDGVRPAATSVSSLFWLLSWVLTLFVLLRLGMLAYLVMATTAYLLSRSLPTLDLGTWYAANIAAGLALFTALAVYAFYRSVAWRGGIVEALSGD